MLLTCLEFCSEPRRVLQSHVKAESLEEQSSDYSFVCFQHVQDKAANVFCINGFSNFAQQRIATRMRLTTSSGRLRQVTSGLLPNLHTQHSSCFNVPSKTTQGGHKCKQPQPGTLPST